MDYGLLIGIQTSLWKEVHWYLLCTLFLEVQMVSYLSGWSHTMDLVVHLATTTWYKGPSIWVRPLVTISSSSGPSETLRRPLEVAGLEASTRVYVYLYITYARADDLSQTKEGPQKGPVHQKRGGLERSKRGPFRTYSGGFHPKVVSYLTHEIHTTGNPRVHGMIHHTTSQIGSHIGCPEGLQRVPIWYQTSSSSKPAVDHAKPLLQSVERSKWGPKMDPLDHPERYGSTMR